SRAVFEHYSSRDGAASQDRTWSGRGGIFSAFCDRKLAVTWTKGRGFKTKPLRRERPTGCGGQPRQGRNGVPWYNGSAREEGRKQRRKSRRQNRSPIVPGKLENHFLDERKG